MEFQAARPQRVASAPGETARRWAASLPVRARVHEAVARGHLVPILGDFRWPEIAIYTVWPQTRHLSARARAFIDFVRARIGPRPYWEAFLDGAGA